MYEGVCPEYIEMVNPPVKVSKIVFMYVCMCLPLVFRTSIRVSFLLEVRQSPVRVSLLFICGSWIFQHNADRERAATGWKGLTDATSKDLCVVPRHVINDVIKTLVTAWKRKNAWSPLSRGMPFFLLYIRHLLFLLETSGSFCKFNSFLFLFFNVI